jgi:signal transduction histidine kinase
MSRGETIFNKVYTKEQKDRWFEYVFANNSTDIIHPHAREFILNAETHTVCFVPEKNSALFSDSWDGSLYTEAEFNVLKRAAKVFEQAYIRFLDLQKAEAQAREAQVEAILEKIRSRSLAMHHSSELKSVIAIIFEKLNELNVLLGTVAIWLFDKGTMDSIFWVGNNWQQPAMVHLPYDEQMMREDTNYKDSWQAWLSGESYINKEYNTEQKDKYFRYVFAHNDLVAIPPAARDIMMKAQKYTACLLVEKNSALYFDSWQEATYDEGRIRVFQGVAKVFEQAYIRFLDLQRAEAHAREAQIEAALEKVRSASLAMHRSEELKDVIIVVFEKLKDLGLVFQNAGIQLFTEGSKDIIQWVASTNLLSAPARVNLPYIEKDFEESEIIRDIWMAKEKGKSVYNKHYSFSEKNKFFEYAARFNNLEQLPKKAREAQMQAPDYTQTLVAEKHSAMWVDSYVGQMISSEGFEVLGRTAKVFEQAYTRFLDLQRAEAHAREAQIEAAMERLRARAMAMQASGELAAVIRIMYTELKKLDASLNRCFIMIFDEQTGGVTWWMAGDDEASTEQAYRIPYSGHPPQLAYLNGWKERQEKWQYAIEGEEKKEWDAFLFSKTELSNLPGIVIQNMKSFEKIYLSASFNSFGCLTTGSVQPLSGGSFDILVRFSRVFDLSYTRFCDLKQAEAQALRAEKDLIEIKVARMKAEDALAALKATQAQLIQAEKMASLGELTAGIAHEIQNPLNFVTNFSEANKELLVEMEEEMGKGNYEEAKVIVSDIKANEEKISHHGRRADNIVKGMLQHSRQSAGEKVATDINALVDEHLELTYHSAKAKDKAFRAALHTDYDPGIGKVSIVPQDMGRVLINLFTNAFYAIHEKKQRLNGTYEPVVTVRTIRKNNCIEIKIADNGTGIPQKALDKIFQPFFTTKPTGEGTGLGLSLSYDIVTKGHGGTLSVQSIEGDGSEFMIELPHVQ